MTGLIIVFVAIIIIAVYKIMSIKGYNAYFKCDNDSSD